MSPNDPLRNEMVMARGHLAEAEKRFAELDILVDGEITMIRRILDPFEDNAMSIDVDLAKTSMERLYTYIHEMRRLYETINKIKRSMSLS